MKRLLFLPIVFFLSFQVQSQTFVIKRKILKDNNKDSLQKIANEFSEDVESALNKKYPSRVRDVLVDLKVIDGQLNIFYIAEIVETTEEEGQHHFDHRGALCTNVDAQNAIIASKLKMEEQKKGIFNDFLENYGEAIVLSKKIDNVKYLDEYWAVSEMFVASRRQ